MHQNQSITGKRRFITNLLMLVLVFSVTGMTSSLSQAEPSGDDTNNSGDRNGSEHMRRGREMRDGPMEELNLSDSQRMAFRKAMQQMHETRQSAGDMHEQLGDLVNSDNYDEKKVRELIQKHSKTMENEIVAASSLMHNFYMSLSQEQKEKFNQIRKQMRERMRRDPMERPPGSGDDTGN